MGREAFGEISDFKETLVFVRLKDIYEEFENNS